MSEEDLTTRLVPSHIAEDAFSGTRRISVFAGDEGDVPRVVFLTAEPEEEGDGELEATFVVLTPADARRFAAGILNAADEADGLTPILFMPSCPAPCCAPTPRVEGR